MISSLYRNYCVNLKISGSSPIPRGEVAGIVIGCIVVIAVIVVVAFFIYRRKPRYVIIPLSSAPGKVGFEDSTEIIFFLLNGNVLYLSGYKTGFPLF